jgi:hypothetical protein
MTVEPTRLGKIFGKKLETFTQADILENKWIPWHTRRSTGPDYDGGYDFMETVQAHLKILLQRDNKKSRWETFYIEHLKSVPVRPIAVSNCVQSVLNATSQ